MQRCLSRCDRGAEHVAEWLGTKPWPVVKRACWQFGDMSVVICLFFAGRGFYSPCRDMVSAEPCHFLRSAYKRWCGKDLFLPSRVSAVCDASPSCQFGRGFPGFLFATLHEHTNPRASCEFPVKMHVHKPGGQSRRAETTKKTVTEPAPTRPCRANFYNHPGDKARDPKHEVQKQESPDLHLNF